MNRPIAVVGAPSSLGIRPHDAGGARRLGLAPAGRREQGLGERLAARDRGEVGPPPHRDLTRQGIRPRNEELVADYSRALAARVAAAGEAGEFVVVLGGDCSIVLGCLLGARRRGGGATGLVYLDAHADFSSPELSRSGSAASMCLALAVGRGDTPLARLTEDGPLADAAHVVLVGRRDEAEPWYGHDALRASAVLDLPGAVLRREGPAAAARAALARLERPQVDGFWIHLDADLLDPAVMPAVDSPLPDGPGLAELLELLRPLARHPRARGLELTIYDPTLDPDRAGAARLTSLLERALCGR